MTDPSTHNRVVYFNGNLLYGELSYRRDNLCAHREVLRHAGFYGAPISGVGNIKLLTKPEAVLTAHHLAADSRPHQQALRGASKRRLFIVIDAIISSFI